jgi:hypothetical protein
VDGLRQADLEAQWAANFCDIYIGTQSHLVSEDEGVSHFAYTAPQGDFELKLPTSKVYMIETDSTVELITEHLASQISAELQGHQVEVRGFEGIGKGALVRS